MVVKKFSKKEYESIYSKVPRICVEVIIKTTNGILLSKRKIVPSKGKWHFPGGTVLIGENLEQSVKRIAKEELNLNVKVNRMLGIIEYQKKEVFGRPISLAFLVDIISGEIKPNFQASEIKFFKKSPRGMILSHRNFINKNLLF